MDTKKLYEQLAHHFTEYPVKAPFTPTLIEILTLMFPADEAEVALKLPFMNTALDDIIKFFPEKGEAIASILDQMADRGMVYAENHPEKGKRYRLMPAIGGWMEMPFFTNRKIADTKKLGALWIQYRHEALGEEMARGVPLMRVVPLNITAPQNTKVMTYDDLVPLVSSASVHAVSNCSCRQIATNAGKGCNHTVRTHLQFGSMAQYMINHGIAEKITKDEALSILSEADKEGLVHLTDNLKGRFSQLCNCCGCSCAFLNTYKSFKLNTISLSNYSASLDDSRCSNCSLCLPRCQMGAITVDGNKFRIDKSLCIGCGLCASVCKEKAISLKQRETVKEPPDFTEYVTKRMKPTTG